MSEASEKEARRRARLRWVTLGEAVAIAAVIISALGLWNNYEDRRAAHADKAAAEATHAPASAPLHLRATPHGDGATLALAPVVADHVIQDQVIRFPPSFGLSPVTTTGDARIEAGWFADALKNDRHKRSLPEETQGDERVPVMIQTSYLENGQTVTARDYYDVGYALEGRFLRGAAVKLRGLSLIGKAAGQDAPADQRLTDLWQARAGKPKK